MKKQMLDGNEIYSIDLKEDRPLKGWQLILGLLCLTGFAMLCLNIAALAREIYLK